MRLATTLLTIILFSCGNNNNKTEQPAPPPEYTSQSQIVPDTVKNVETIPPKVYTEMDYVGKRNIILTVTESDCNTQEIGNIRPETWSISIENGEIKMNVSSHTRTIEKYVGEMKGEELHLKGKRESLLGVAGQGTIKLKFNEAGKIIGTRKVSTTDNSSNPCSFEQTIKEQ